MSLKKKKKQDGKPCSETLEALKFKIVYKKYFPKGFFGELFHKVFASCPKARGVETEVKTVLILAFWGFLASVEVSSFHWLDFTLALLNFVTTLILFFVFGQIILD